MSEDHKKIKTMKDLRANLGKVLYYETSNSRYITLRTVVIERIEGNNLWTNSGNVEWFPDLKRHGLRNYMGEEWEKKQ